MTNNTENSSNQGKKILSLLEALKQVNYQNSMMLRWVNGAVITVDRDDRVLEANDAALAALGWSKKQFVGRHLHETIHHSQEDGSDYPYDFCPEFAAIEDGSSHHVDGDVFWHKDGSSFSADFIVCPTRDDRNEITGAILTFRNLTEQRIQEANRIHSLKLESIGELAAGIAHEINTPIQFIGSNLDFLKESFTNLLNLIPVYQQLKNAVDDLPQFSVLCKTLEDLEQDADIGYLQDETPKAFDQTMDGVDRVSKLVRGLKGFAHVGDSENKQQANLNEIIANTLIVCHNAYKYVAEVETDYAELPLVKVLPGDIGQVIINLVVNAAHAIADKKKDSENLGKIIIKTESDEKCVTISVSDTGGGIPEAIRSRIFDPFFSTKDVGRGSGQGLAISRTIIHDKHNGELSFKSTVNQGTTFFVRLPI